jgi:hypothetical protein
VNLSLADIHRRQDQFYDSLIEGFQRSLQHIVTMAQARMSGYLQANLSITAGKIDRTSGNLRLMRTLDDKFMGFLDDAGYTSLLNAYVTSFAGEKVFLQETLESLGYKPVDFTAGDLNIFASLQLNAVTSMTTVAEAAAGAAMQQALFSVGGLKFADLVESLASKIDASLPRVTTIAETAMTSFFRTMTDQAFQKIEKDLPEIDQRYRYSGPEDMRTRPFCERLLLADKTYSRAEIDAMSNGQLPQVMTSAGGFNCRHQWLIQVRKTELAQVA